jgi:diguanylate cyclase (GGDEF)-like protein
MPRTDSVSPAGVAVALEKAVRSESGASLLLVDLDNLQDLNEKGGREAGDKAIAAAARTLANRAKTDRWTFGRLGGDEFALVAPGLSLEAAFLRGERVRAEVVAALHKAIPGKHRTTATVGVANAPRDAKTVEQLMRKADLALYAAKEQGGNTVGLPPAEDMVLRSSYYSRAQLGRLRSLGDRVKKKEAVLLREALDDLLRKYERT